MKANKHLGFGAKAFTRLRERILSGEALPGFYRKGSWLVARIIATPKWADFAEIRKVYRHADDLTTLIGEEYSVDHIIPLRHPRVCGLHVANNLRVLPTLVNAGKGNYFCPEQMEMFLEPEQLRLI